MRQRTAEEFLALMGKTLDASYLEAVLSGPGGEAFRAVAAVGERLSAAVVRLWSGLSPCRASFGSIAVGTVRLTRTGTAAGTLGAGSALMALNGQRVVILADATWAEGVTTPVIVAAASWYRSWSANLGAGTPLSVWEPLPAPLFDATIIAEVQAGFTGGRPPEMETVGAQKGLQPRPGETLEAFRIRFGTLEECVTPVAVEAAAKGIIPGAEVVEVPYSLSPYLDDADGAFLDGDLDPLSDDPAFRLSDLVMDQGTFIVRVPLQAVGADDERHLWLDYGHLTPDFADSDDMMDCFLGAPLYALSPAGKKYDMGNHGDREDIARMCYQLSRIAPAGSRWWVEEPDRR